MPRARDSLRQQVADLQRQLSEAQEERDRAKRDVGVAWGMYNREETRLIRALRDAAEQRALAERLRGAGVTDYSSLGINRVDCHFCPGVWRADEPAKHKTTCPLAKAQEEGNGG